MQKLIDVQAADCERLRSIMYHLYGLAKSFRRTGNDIMAEELGQLASEISIVEKKFSRDAYESAIREDNPEKIMRIREKIVKYI